MKNIFDKKYLGHYYMDSNDILYKFIAYCECPSVTLEDVETKERINFGTVGFCVNDFVRLTKEQQ